MPRDRPPAAAAQASLRLPAEVLPRSVTSSKLTACPYCVPAMRESEIKAINETYAPGGDHEELLNSLRKNYYEYLAQE